MDLSIIILNYNTRDFLRKCLQSVFSSSTLYKFEVLVADNGSIDGSIEMVKKEFPQVKLFQNNLNLGYAAGNNIAIKEANGKYLLLLNSDTTVRPDTFQIILSYIEKHPEIGALGCKILLANGEIDQASKRNFPNPWNSFLRLFGFRKFSNYNIQGSVDTEMEVDSVVGAFMMVPKEVVEKVGMLDEDFFLYGEDLDWCFRIKKAGYKVVYYPKAEITHFKYASSKNIPYRTIRWAHDAMRIFYRKHYAKDHGFLFNQFIFAGINFRMYLVILINLFRRKKTVH